MTGSLYTVDRPSLVADAQAVTNVGWLIGPRLSTVAGAVMSMSLGGGTAGAAAHASLEVGSLTVLAERFVFYWLVNDLCRDARVARGLLVLGGAGMSTSGWNRKSRDFEQRTENSLV